jgi:serine/threonine protein kinase
MTFYIEYILKQNLTQYANEDFMSQLSNKKQIQILMNINHDLQFMHNRMIIHRDIKSKNIIYDQDSQRVVLCDFDLAYQDLINKSEFNEETLFYISSEYIMRQRPYSDDI